MSMDKNSQGMDFNQPADVRDISSIQDEDTGKTKKYFFIVIIVIVMGIIGFVVFNSLSSDESENQNSSNMEFLDDENDQFFMDSPADAIDEANNNNDVDNLQEDTAFSKETLLEEKDSEVEISSASSISPVSSTTIAEKREPQSESLMSKENETPVVKTIAPEKIENIPNQMTDDRERHYYIQVGTFLKYHPNKKFLQSIKDNGLNYQLDVYHNSNNKEITRVLVGPFENKSDANEALLIVHEKIAKDGYLLKTRLH
jgi:DedD protein